MLHAFQLGVSGILPWSLGPSLYKALALTLSYSLPRLNVIRKGTQKKRATFSPGPRTREGKCVLLMLVRKKDITLSTEDVSVVAYYPKCCFLLWQERKENST